MALQQHLLGPSQAQPDVIVLQLAQAAPVPAAAYPMRTVPCKPHPFAVQPFLMHELPASRNDFTTNVLQSVTS
jgi:hypothetical protein